MLEGIDQIFVLDYGHMHLKRTYPMDDDFQTVAYENKPRFQKHP